MSAQKGGQRRALQTYVYRRVPNLRPRALDLASRNLVAKYKLYKAARAGRRVHSVVIDP